MRTTLLAEFWENLTAWADLGEPLPEEWVETRVRATIKALARLKERRPKVKKKSWAQHFPTAAAAVEREQEWAKQRKEFAARKQRTPFVGRSASLLDQVIRDAQRGNE